MTAPTAGPSEGPAQPNSPPGTDAAHQRPTRISAAWIATGVALVLLVLLLVFILQNLQRVQLHYFGFHPTMPIGVAMLLAAVIGGVVVAIIGALRVIQVRRARTPPDS